MSTWVILLREMMRAIAFPLRMLAHLAVRTRWRTRMRVALEEPPSRETHDHLAVFLAKHSPRKKEHPHLFVSAGEASGETHAAKLMEAVRAAGLVPRWSCFGGEEMTSQGGELLWPLSENPIMGVAGALSALPWLLRAERRFEQLLREDPPDLCVLIDYPGLHMVMARACRRAGVPVIHYIAPQYWAWAPWRVHRYRRCIDATLTILPFESNWFNGVGIPADYVGHPMLDQFADHRLDEAKLEQVRSRPTLCLMPGSRRKEIQRTLPGMVRVARKLQAAHPELRTVVAHRDEKCSDLIRAVLTREDANFVEFEPGSISEWLAGSRLVLVKSGTGSLEVSLHGTPSVVIYKTGGALWQIVRTGWLDAPWFALTNLVMGRKVVPEFCFCTDRSWSKVASAAEQLWRDGLERESCLEGLRELPAKLGEPGASSRAARWITAYFTGEDLPA